MLRTETRDEFHATWTLQVRSLADANKAADAAGKKEAAPKKQTLTAEERKAANGWHSCFAGMCAAKPKPAAVEPAGEPKAK
jgi:hypothetical protein